MSASLLVIGIVVVFLMAHYLYGWRIGKYFQLSDSKPTPAEKYNDGFDFVPTKKPILLAQHFASIAAAGPVVGPIAAALAFGWGPTLLWIVLGCVFIGACHDLSSLLASVRHDAKSLPEIAKQYFGTTGFRLTLAFIWLCLVYVIIAFTDVTARQFVAKEEWGGVLHDIGGGVATSSFLYLLLSVLMGLALTKLKISLGMATAVFFPLLAAIIVLGQKLPLVLPVADPVAAWSILILLYCALASVLPMWLLLQPRGYLGGYFLYIIVVVGILGLCFGGFDIQYPLSKGFYAANGDALYPFLFITVACGACSGFHGLVCSGTTSKQLGKESHAPLVGYGGMLLEGLVAVLALATVMIWPPGHATLSKSPSEIYATGIAHFTRSILGLPIEWGITFGMLAFATFVYDTLDVATRLGRYLIEEMLGLRGWLGRAVAISATLALPFLYVFASPAFVVAGRQVPLWQAIWPLFGSSNQLLAGLTLLLVAVWLRHQKKWPAWLLIPAAFMLSTSSYALVLQLKKSVTQLMAVFNPAAMLNAVISGALLLVAVGIIISGLRSLFPKNEGISND
ncbi:MAG: carbon starvation protein A [Deltaproteobacteria bacterium]|nr:carbon starvation protein A [Deltaproteobacteria bacterium]